MLSGIGFIIKIDTFEWCAKNITIRIIQIVKKDEENASRCFSLCSGVLRRSLPEKTVYLK